jgi:hypothetical protein
MAPQKGFESGFLLIELRSVPFLEFRLNWQVFGVGDQFLHGVLVRSRNSLAEQYPNELVQTFAVPGSLFPTALEQIFRNG